MEDHPIKTVLIGALIVVAIVGVMVGLMVLGELAVNWF
jgi:hypothetical protein